MPEEEGRDASKPVSLGRCPICGRPSDEKLKPFCSKRCADIDLNRWLTGGYVISTDNDDESERPDDASGDA